MRLKSWTKNFTKYIFLWISLNFFESLWIPLRSSTHNFSYFTYLWISLKLPKCVRNLETNSTEFIFRWISLNRSEFFWKVQRTIFPNSSLPESSRNSPNASEILNQKIYSSSGSLNVSESLWITLNPSGKCKAQFFLIYLSLNLSETSGRPLKSWTNTFTQSISLWIPLKCPLHNFSQFICL